VRPLDSDVTAGDDSSTAGNADGAADAGTASTPALMTNAVSTAVAGRLRPGRHSPRRFVVTVTPSVMPALAQLSRRFGWRQE
jgi:hypothetical protein